MPEPGTYIVDAWPVLEWFRQRQPSTRRLEEFLLSAAQRGATLLMFRMNYGEIYYKALDYSPEDEASRYLSRLPRYVHLASVDDDLVQEAAPLKFRFRASYADWFAAALAIRHNAPVVTEDPDFLRLQNAGILQVEWLGA